MMDVFSIIGIGICFIVCKVMKKEWDFEIGRRVKLYNLIVGFNDGGVFGWVL